MQPLAEIALAVAFNALWQGAIIAMVTAVVLRCLSARSSALRYRLLWTGFAAVAVVPVASVVADRANGPEPLPSVAPSPNSANEALPYEIGARSTRIGAAVSEESRANTPPESVHDSEGARFRGLRATADVAAWFLGAYLMIVTGLLTRIAIAVVRVRRLAGASTPVPERISTAVALIARRGDVRRSVRVAASRHIGSPAFAGFVRPVLLLPARDIDVTDDEHLRFAAAHELAHAHRRDDWFALAERVVMAVYVGNPGVRWLAARLERTREMACDEWAVATTGASPERYVDALVRIAERSVAQRSTPAFAPGFTGSSLHERVSWLESRRSRV